MSPTVHQSGVNLRMDNDILTELHRSNSEAF
jgi:hypothetical protein